MEVDGREIPRGFGIVQGQHKEFSNPLTQMPVGRRGLVDLKVNRRHISPNTPREQLEYLVVTEPIPSGATVIEKAVSGDFERFEIMPGTKDRTAKVAHADPYQALPEKVIAE